MIIIIIKIINKTRRKTKFKMSELEYYLSGRVGKKSIRSYFDLIHKIEITMRALRALL